MAKYELWGVDGELRGHKITLRRTRNVSPRSPDAYKTELVCLQRSLPLAHMKTEANALWALVGWIKVLDPILNKFELDGYVEPPAKIVTPQDFCQAIEATKRKVT